ncbi:hypothetical protein YC2023_111522 [Brassica napus]
MSSAITMMSWSVHEYISSTKLLVNSAIYLTCRDGYGPVTMPCDKVHLGIKDSIPPLLQRKEPPLHRVNGLMGRSVVVRRSRSPENPKTEISILRSVSTEISTEEQTILKVSRSGTLLKMDAKKMKRRSSS